MFFYVFWLILAIPRGLSLNVAVLLYLSSNHRQYPVVFIMHKASSHSEANRVQYVSNMLVGVIQLPIYA